MAAILCHGINQACGSTCQKLSYLPCCNTTDDDDDYELDENGNRTPRISTKQQQQQSSNSKWRHRICTCGGYLSTLKHICTNPFGIFVTVTIVSNLPPMLIALTEIGNIEWNIGGGGSGSSSSSSSRSGNGVCSASVWLLINFLFSWIHIIASFYIAFSINHRMKRDHSTASTSTTPPKEPPSYSPKQRRLRHPDKTIYRRASNLFCYDPVMAVYIMTVCGYAGFLFIPQLLHLDYPQSNSSSGGGGNCTIYVHEKVIASVGFAWAFLAFGLGALALSFGFAYVDATRQSRHAAAMMSIYDKDMSPSDLDVTSTMGTYTSMDEEALVASGQLPKNDSENSSNNDQKYGRRGGKHHHHHHHHNDTNKGSGDDYIPPLIDNASTTENANDDGIIVVMSSTEETANTQKQKRRRKYQRNRSDGGGGDETEVETVGMVTDYETSFDGADGDVEEEEDDEDDSDLSIIEGLGTTSRDVSSDKQSSSNNKGRRPRRSSKFTTTILSYDDEDDAFPTSFEVQNSDTDGFTTDAMYTDMETDIEKALDLTDVDGSVITPSNRSAGGSTMRLGGHFKNGMANLDLVLGVSNDDPTISIDLTEEDGTTEGEEDGNASTGGGSLSSKASTRSVLSMFKRRGRANKSNGTADESSSTGADKQQEKINPLKRVIDLVAPDMETDQEDDRNHASLTYSTSMGSAVGPAEPLSFVDGGSCNEGTKPRIFSIPESQVRGCDPPGH